jgi:hypothetical protein
MTHTFADHSAIDRKGNHQDWRVALNDHIFSRKGLEMFIFDSPRHHVFSGNDLAPAFVRSHLVREFISLCSLRSKRIHPNLGGR